MHPPTHLMLSWALGHRLPSRRDRCLVAWGGVAPDLDGLTLLAGTALYGEWHHVLTHGLSAALVTTGILTSLANDKLKVALFTFAAFHLHLVCDLLGSGIGWPIQYWWPLDDTFYRTPYGWELDAWQNWVIGVAALILCLRLALRSGHSLAECVVSARLDEDVVTTLRRRVRGLSPPASG